MMDTQLPRREGNYLYAIVVISVAAVGGFLFGYDRERFRFVGENDSKASTIDCSMKKRTNRS